MTCVGGVTCDCAVVDVYRTDQRLEFYARHPANNGRMSDILAVHAWIDPATGFCQGMCDIVSPFLMLFEDDADAFWCFELLFTRLVSAYGDTLLLFLALTSR